MELVKLLSDPVQSCLFLPFKWVLRSRAQQYTRIAVTHNDTPHHWLDDDDGVDYDNLICSDAIHGISDSLFKHFSSYHDVDQYNNCSSYHDVDQYNNCSSYHDVDQYNNCSFYHNNYQYNNCRFYYSVDHHHNREPNVDDHNDFRYNNHNNEGPTTRGPSGGNGTLVANVFNAANSVLGSLANATINTAGSVVQTAGSVVNGAASLLGNAAGSFLSGASNLANNLSGAVGSVGGSGSVQVGASGVRAARRFRRGV
uniref:Uncharacterized protein n=1 Tax=Anopheles atroparvus TaxID=41427 RepID=A0A182JL89_ANOAO